MKKKRVIKLFMAMGYSRNEAAARAAWRTKSGGSSYREFGRLLLRLREGDLF